MFVKQKNIFCAIYFMLAPLRIAQIGLVKLTTSGRMGLGYDLAAFMYWKITQ